MTGGGSGIGRTMCKMLAKRGCYVVIADINAAAAEAVGERTILLLHILRRRIPLVMRIVRRIGMHPLDANTHTHTRTLTHTDQTNTHNVQHVKSMTNLKSQRCELWMSS